MTTCTSLTRQLLDTIHQIPIWLTNWSVPATNYMKVRLVSLMFCFGNASPEKSCLIVECVFFVSFSQSVFVFLNATRREWSLPLQRKCFFTFERKTNRWRQGVHDHWRSCLSSGWKILENVQAIAFSSKVEEVGYGTFEM